MTNLTIVYAPAARGDFLASLLLDQIGYTYREHTTRVFDYNTDYVRKNYTKLHIVKDLTELVSPHTIRIALTDLDDILTVAYLWTLKKLPWTPTQNEIIEYLITHERCNKELDRHFTHIVKFKDLFSVQFLADFYHKYKQRPMPEEYVHKLDHNIAMQTQLTTTDYHRFLTEVTLDLHTVYTEPLYRRLNMYYE